MSKFLRLSRCWFLFPGEAKVACNYELFLCGLIQHFPLLAEDYVVRIEPTSLL